MRRYFIAHTVPAGYYDSPPPLTVASRALPMVLTLMSMANGSGSKTHNKIETDAKTFIMQSFS